MKAVFPCKGVVVLTKNDVEALEAFYKTTLLTSKMNQIYGNTDYSVQVGNFNYLPPKTTIILNEQTLLTIPKLRSIMNKSTIVKKEPKIEEDTISDEDILSHPFFKTLKPIE